MTSEPKVRLLTFGELEMLTAFFNDRAAFRVAMVHDTIDPRAQEVFDNRGTSPRSHQHDGNLYMLNGDYSDDYTKASTQLKALFIHEMAHVWQYRRTGYKSGMVARNRRADVLADMIYESELCYQVLYKDLAPSKRAALMVVAQEYLDSLEGVRMDLLSHTNGFKDAYLFSNNDANQAAVSMGPKPKWQAEAEEDVRRSLVSPFKESIGAPRDGETFSDYAWRNPSIQKHFSSKAAMIATWTDYDQLDYNYILQPMGNLGFFDLHDEAQAQMITDYFLIKNGIDPRTVPLCISVSGRKRPPLDYYEKIIPFAKGKTYTD